MKSQIISVIEIKKEGSKLVAHEAISGNKVFDKMPYSARKQAFDNKLFLIKTISKNGNVRWKRSKEIPEGYKPKKKLEGLPDVLSDDYTKLSDDEIRTHIQECYRKKPNTLVLDKLNWKLAVRALLRGENIIFLGHSGGGKTLTATTLAKVYNRPLFKFNMGSMQDARTALIGNTHYNPDKGTFFAQSEFISAITTPHSIVLLDEATRMSQDAENILITPLDADQRYIRIDEDPSQPVIKVAEGVVFFATANVGAEYTSTRIIDRATKDRFTTLIQIPLLNEDQEYNLLKTLYPKVNNELLRGVAKMAHWSREEINSEHSIISTIISTRSTVEQVALLVDGFKFREVMEALVVPMFDGEGGIESEQSKIKQVIQGYSNLDKIDVFDPNIKEEATDEEVAEAFRNRNSSDENLFDPEDDAISK